MNDAKIGVEMISKEDIKLENKTFLCDKGYDSIAFKNKLTDMKNNFIIPKNKKIHIPKK